MPSPIKNFKKLFFGSLIALALTVSLFALPVQAYTWEEFGEDIGDMFSGSDDNGLTFTSYEGQLASLSEEGYDSSLTRQTNVRDFVITLVNYALGFLGLLAVIIVIYGGVLYVTAAGEEERSGKGKKAITYATIGLLIVLGSFAFVNTVIESVSNGGETGQDLTGAGGPGGSGSELRSANSFNAAASQIRAIAQEIYNGFAFLGQSTEDFKGIQADSKKDSLFYGNFPSKASMREFLENAKFKLNKMKNGTQSFTEAQAKINEEIRKIDEAIDLINIISGSQYVKWNGEDVDTCDDSDKGGFGEGFDEAVDDKNNCEQDGFFKYDGGKRLLMEWNQILYYFTPLHTCDGIAPKGGYAEGGKLAATDLKICIYPIVEDLAANYKSVLTKKLEELNEIWSYVSIIKAIGEGDAAGYFTNMILYYTGLQGHIVSWDIETDIAQAAEPLLEGLRQQAKLYEELLKIDFVRARLTADVVEGNAPLTVIFDTFRSTDPAGGSITGEKIVWDLAGVMPIQNLYQVPPGTMVTPGLTNSDIMTCENVTSPYYTPSPAIPTSTGVLGRTAQRCTFHRAGSYQSAVMIASNEDTKFGPGLSVLNIKVNPPATEINLHAYSGTTPPTPPNWISHYVDGILSVDRNDITFTLTEAQAGITFDGSATTASQYKWDFGDGTILDFSPANATTTHVYDQTGDYPVTFAVINALGTTDRKIFTVHIDNVSARIEATPPNNAYINTPVNFDGSRSRSDVGQIRQYEWTIVQNPPTPPTPFTFSDSGANLRSINVEFPNPGSYNITLTVTNGNGDQSTATLNNYLVQSQPPVAQFDYESEDENQPSVFQLDAGRSYDPDGPNNALEYDWAIVPDETSNTWHWVSDPVTGDQVRPIIKFLERGSYQVTLKVTDLNTAGNPVVEEDSITQTIEVNDVLDIAWSPDQAVTANLDAAGQADLDFSFTSENAVAYDIDFGDQENASGDMFGTETITHKYTSAGRYTVNLTVYDADDNDKTITKRIFIGGGTDPIARIQVFVDDADVTDEYDGTDPIELTRSDVVKFDAGFSVNKDGTGRNLRYSWDFGDTGRSSNKQATHSFDELSPADPGYFEVTLKISDKDDPTLNDTDTVRIKIASVPPSFSAIQALPVSGGSDLTTPVTMNLRAYGAEDPDGDIVQYRWWYFDMDDPEEPLGMQVTTNDSAKITIGTKGQAGKEKTYGFALVVTDKDNLTFSSEDIYNEDTVPQITVINGANELPVAKFNVDVTKILAGEKITFTSASKDPDGSIIQYVWDFEGDGFFNNEPTEFSTIEHTYTAKNLNGYKVRLKVIDDKGGESISEPISIFVDSLAKPPVAAFKAQVVEGSDGRKIKFLNNSTSDEAGGSKIISYKWDFDTASNLETADSDGDGTKDNDLESQAKEPEKLYTEYGTYSVKLTVTDDQGNSDDVINTIKIPLANAPVAAFTFEFKDGKVVFHNNSAADQASSAKIIKYVWDFDTASNLVNADSDGDGFKDNDHDSDIQNPSYEYKESGNYKVKLTVFDDQGNEDDVVNQINVKVVVSPTGDSITGGGAGDIGQLKAVLTTSPLPQADGAVYLEGTKGSVTFDFSKSEGNIAYYIIDKNIYFDTGGNGIKTDDEDFKTSLPGTWKTNFEKAWGQTSVQLTVVDIYGVKSTQTIAIKFIN